MNRIEEFTMWAKKYKRKNNSEDVFLQLKNEIFAYLKEGFTIKLIYFYLKEKNKFSYSYETFRILVNKHIKNQKQYLENDNYLNVSN